MGRKNKYNYMYFLFPNWTDEDNEAAIKYSKRISYTLPLILMVLFGVVVILAVAK